MIIVNCNQATFVLFLAPQSIRETLRIESITGEVGEEGIEEGDQLLKLGNDDVSQMPLIRGP